MLLLDWSLITLAAIAFSASTIAGVFGFAGGMLLVAALPHFVPPAAIIPLHSAAQLVSNTSRALLDYRSIHWPFLMPYFIGSLLGIALVFSALSRLDLSFLPAIIGIYILINTWSDSLSKMLTLFNSFYVIGAIQTGISLLVGAPGPLSLPLLVKRLSDHHKIVCTMAAFMSVGHILKLAIFTFLGFKFAEYWQEILALAVAAYLGSLLGTRLRHKLPLKNYLWAVKLLLTVLSLLAIYRSLTA